MKHLRGVPNPVAHSADGNARRRLLATLTLTVAAATACGSAPAAVSSPPPNHTATAAPMDCPRIVCDPDADYGQPTLSALQDAESRIGPTRSVATTGSSSGTAASSQTSSATSTPQAVAGPAGPEGPAGPAGPAGATSPDFGALYTKYKNSVAEFLTLNCSDHKQYIGSGFLVAPDLVATAAHVVYNQRVEDLVIDGKSVSGRVIGLDQPRDVALIKLTSKLPAPSIALAHAWPAVGSPLAVIGYAQGGVGAPLSMQQGHVSAVNITVNGGPGYIETDTAEDHGSSGGPVLDPSGQAVAIVSKTIGVDGLVKLQAGSIGASALFNTWTAHPSSVSYC